MTEQPDLRPATAEEVEETLSFALRFKGRKRADVRVRWWRRSQPSIYAGTLKRLVS